MLYKLFTPALFTIDPEAAHRMTIKALKAGVIPHGKRVESDMLRQKVFGLAFDNPVGLAAGFDKNAEVIAPILKLGFGFTEVGTVTPQPQDGNPKPRVFRDPQNEAVINRMGFPNAGAEVFEKHIRKFKTSSSNTGLLCINIGMNKTQTKPVTDYVALIERFAALADYLTINISSPNTPGLRDLQKRKPLLELLKAVLDARAIATPKNPPPLLVKLAPDLDDAQVEELCSAVIEAKIDGVIISNTTLARPDYLSDDFRGETGGLSGKPLKGSSTEILRKFYMHLKGKMPIIGVGGVSSAQDAYDKIRAGASLVQLYTGLIYEGPCVANSINRGLIDLLQRDGFDHIGSAIGIDH